MLVMISTIATFVALFLLVVRPHLGVLAVIIVRPIIDATWDEYLPGGIRLGEIISVMTVVLVIFYALFRAKPEESINAMPLRNIWLVYVFFMILSSMIILYNEDVNTAMSIFFRTFSGFIGFYMIQAFYYDKEKIKAFLLALTIAGIFPLLMGVYSFLTGFDWRHEQSEGLTRHIGLYHDSFGLRFLMLQFLLGLLLFTSLQENKKYVLNFIYFTFAIFAVIVLFRTYSKSGTVISVSWILMWTIFRKKYMALAIAAGCVVLIGIYYLPDLVDTIYTMFHKEIGVLDGTLGTERSFAGRWYGWYEIVDVWLSLGLLAKLFGSGINSIAAHNDYLMILMHGGIVTLAIYVTLLITVGIKLFKNILITPSIMNVAGLMALSMWVVDSIGLVPSAYSGYQWFIWGLIGLSLRLAQEENNISDSNIDPYDSGAEIKKISRFISARKST